MANEALTWLESNERMEPVVRADKAAKAVVEIYELNKEYLSETAKKQYHIKIEGLENNKVKAKR